MGKRAQRTGTLWEEGLTGPRSPRTAAPSSGTSCFLCLGASNHRAGLPLLWHSLGTESLDRSAHTRMMQALDCTLAKGGSDTKIHVRTCEGARHAHSPLQRLLALSNTA